MLPAMYHLDHVVPLWKGGSNDLETNSQALCVTCHTTKTLNEERERQDQLWAARRKAVEAARAADPKFKAVKRPRKLKPTDCAFVDPVLDNNPFIQYAFIPEKEVRCQRIA